MLVFECPSCRTKLQVAEEHAGKTIACPKCQTKAIVPKPVEPPVEVGIVPFEEPRPERSRPRMRTRNDEDDDDDDADADADEIDRGPEFAYPSMVGMAAIAWIVFGCLILLSGGANVVMLLTRTAAANAPGEQVAGTAFGAVCGVSLVLLFGLAFIIVGTQTLRGTAQDTLGNGIGSVVFGLLNLGCGVAAFAAGFAVAGAPAFVAIIGAVVNLTAGVGLLSAGVMALVGRQPYLDWRRSQSRRRRRR